MMGKRSRMVSYWVVGFVVILVVSAVAYLQHPKFGRLPEGERLAEIERSPNYSGDGFQNLVDTPMFAGDKTFFQVLFENLNSSGERLEPVSGIPSVQTDLNALDPREDVVVWLGHSSFYVQLNGQRILIDPVFSTGAAPLPFLNQAYAGTHDYAADDIPAVDALLITHDHWDHLDYPSVQRLKPKVRQVLAPLGVGSYFQGWGYDASIIREGDWFDRFDLVGNVRVHLIPARHYSGRLLTRGKTLWAGFVLETPDRRILFSGDSGYGPHFTEIGKRFGGFDFVALDSGQYDPRWPYIHMTPEEAVAAAEELNARSMMPAHVAKFTLARHSWDEPFERITVASEAKGFDLLTPMIGEPVQLDGEGFERFGSWWQ
ncbi:MAG: MBL fold metallo-hydrolase [Marinobacter sp.]|nr:MBL fold metallo-hydrolase [Marinobacter sp.]